MLLDSPRCSWDGGPGDAIEHRRKLAGQCVKWGQVASDPGEDDGSLKGGDDHDGEIFRALEGGAEVDQTLRERLEPAVECTTEHLAELLAGGCRVRCRGNQRAPGRELLLGERSLSSRSPTHPCAG
jgi:hypothetical protein